MHMYEMQERPTATANAVHLNQQCAVNPFYVWYLGTFVLSLQ
jgi:hypothetical protein